ncbi:MAG TPA: hypothetical protein VK968_19510, partial [Roseimicrobium sp.]|nr:hypothetical protein [Roseimicrobium sp.]
AFLATTVLAFTGNILTIEREGDTVHLSWPTSEGGYRLQATGDLGAPAWQDMTATYEDRRFNVVEPLDQSKKFYRLVRDSKPDGRITIEVVLFQIKALPFTALTFDEANSSLPEIYSYTVSFVNTKPLAFDASNAYNSRTGSNSGITFHWSIEYQEQTVPNPYRVAGITGYDTPVLHILPNSLIPTVEPQTVTFVLTVTDPLNPDLARDEIRIQITGEVASSATLADYHIANADPANAPNPNLIAVP